MILIDTSVWIDYFRQEVKVINDVELLIDSSLVIAFEPVFSELLYGGRTKRDKELITTVWNMLPKATFHEGSLLKAASFSSENKLYNKGIGLMDAAIMLACHEGKYKLWTHDKKMIKFLDPVYLYKT